jgi:hypothetical protein
MNKQEMIAEVAAAALLELDKMEAQRIKRAAPREILEQLFKGMGDPQPAEKNIDSVSPLPVVPPEFPQLRVRYGLGATEFGRQLSRLSGEAALKFLQASCSGVASEWVILQKIDEIAPFVTWLVRPMAELETLKAEGVPEFTPPRKAAIS